MGVLLKTLKEVNILFNMFVSLGRVISYAFKNFFRNFWLSFITLTILFLAMATVHVLIILNVLADTAISQVEEKISINVYFKSDVKEEQVLNVQQYLMGLQEVDEVKYISPDDALVSFRAEHQNDQEILDTLEVLGENPLGATLVVSSSDTQHYNTIINSLESEQYDELIEDKDFDDYRTAIDKIVLVTDRVSFAVTIMAVVFGLISILIVFNAIRVAIYTHREEIRVMALVGATDSFIIAPYIIEGILFALLAVVLSILVTYPFLGVIQPWVATFFESGTFNIVEYYNSNFIMIFGLQFVAAAIINIAAGLVATHRYVKY